MKKIKLIFFMILIYTTSLSEVVFQVSTSAVQVYEPFVLSVEFINQEKDSYNIEGLENFEIISKGSKNSYNYINGNITSIRSERYSLQAINNGKYILKLRTDKGIEKEVIINVSENKKVEQQLSSKYFIDDSLKKKTYYFGEKIPYEESFVSFVGLSSFSQLKIPEFNDFSVKDLTNYNRKNYPQELIEYNGRKAIKLGLYRGILQPNSSGKKQILSSLIKIGEETGDFFSNRIVNVPRKRTELEIKSLPSENKPLNFKDIVGTIQKEESWNKTSGKVGEAIVLNLKLYGAGNLELLDSLNTDDGENFNIYQNIKNYKEEIDGGKYYNEKVFEIALIPKISGNLKTPQFTIYYFNTNTKKYEKLIIAPQNIQVVGKNSLSITESEQSKVSRVEENNKVLKEKNSSKKLEEINIKVVKSEKIGSKNIYKLISGLVSLIAILELVVIIYLIKNRKNNKK